MKAAVLLSLLLHVGIVVTMMLDLPGFGQDKPKPMKVIPIEMVKLGQKTKLVATQKIEPKLRNKPKPKKPQPKRKTEVKAPTKVASSTMPELKDKPKPKKQKKKVEKKPKEIKAKPPVKQKAKPKRQFDSSKLAALLDKREKTQEIKESIPVHTYTPGAGLQRDMCPHFCTSGR